MKKLLFLLVTLLLSVSLFACGEDEGDGDNGNGDTSGEGSGTAESYTVTWYSHDGNKITEETLTKGSVPSRTYNVIDTAEWDYTFLGWRSQPTGDALSTLPAISADVSYYASVTRAKRSYTVSFDVGDAQEVEAQTVEYGAFAAEPDEPVYEGHRFMGWFTDEDFTVPADFTKAITGATTFYAAFNEKLDIGALLEALLDGYKLNPFSKIPEAMRHDYADRLVDSSDVVTDYSGFVSVSDITSHGFGEQWNMVLDNINESAVFFNLLSVVDGLITVSVTAFNNYIDTNASDTAHHAFESGIYNVTIDFDGNIIFYVLDYTATVGPLGEQSVQIAMCMDVETGAKTVRVQIGDANALFYTLTDSGFELALKYFGVRRAYLSLTEDEGGNVTGHIYEHLYYEGSELSSSAADFYITDGYLTAVGNKADGMIGFDGYISETYDTDSGELVGYEVRETLSSIVYNTLWLDLDLVSGINSVKFVRNTSDKHDGYYVYLNGSSTEFKTKTVAGTLDLLSNPKALSRRFDIELRTQYFYSYDSTSEKYVKIKASVPMLMVQEENYGTLTSDILEKNSVALSASIATANLNKILADYDAYIDPFIINKDAITAEIIVQYIGGKISFEE